MLQGSTGKVPNDVVFVLGAGVDRSLDLPLMNTMFRDLNEFAKVEGNSIDKALRRHTKSMKFDLGTYAADQGEALGKKLLGARNDLLPAIQSALAKHSDPQNRKVLLLQALITKITNISEQNVLDEDILGQLAELTGEEPTAGNDTLFETNNIIFRPATRQAMRRILTTLPEDIPNLTIDEKAAFWSLTMILSNFEEMMGELFSGFFTKNRVLQKKYFYLSWLLWAYIQIKAEAGKANRDTSFYKTLDEVGAGGGIITFNYTNFFDDATRPTDGYFHGDCKAYIRFDTREYIDGDDVFHAATDVQKIAEFIKNLQIDWDQRVPKTYLSGLVPPLSVKPIVCTEYLDRWYNCGQIIKSVRKLVIIGYSFNVADEHFNDLIRKYNTGAELIVINPEIDPVIDDVCRVTNFDKSNLSAMTKHGLNCSQGGRLTFLSAKAQDLDATLLLQIIGR